MKYLELKDKNPLELNELFRNLRVKLGKLSFDLNAKSLKDTSLIKKTKKEIARVLTARKHQPAVSK